MKTLLVALGTLMVGALQDPNAPNAPSDDGSDAPSDVPALESHGSSSGPSRGLSAGPASAASPGPRADIARPQPHGPPRTPTPPSNWRVPSNATTSPYTAGAEQAQAPTSTTPSSASSTDTAGTTPGTLHNALPPAGDASPNAPYRGTVSTDRRGRTGEPIPLGDLRLDDARGHWLVIHFAHGWCPTCDDTARNLDQIAAVTQPQGVLTIVVTADSSAWQKKVAPDIGVVDNAPLAEQYEGQTAVVDPAGRVHVLSANAPAPSDVQQIVAPHPTRDPVQVFANATTTGSRGSIAMTFIVAPGYHVMSATPSRPEYFALRVNVKSKGAVHVEPPTYPSEQFATSAGDRVSVYTGKFVVDVPFTIADNAPPGLVELPADVRYQVCSDRVCLFPTDAHPKVVVDVH